MLIRPIKRRSLFGDGRSGHHSCDCYSAGHVFIANLWIAFDWGLALIYIAYKLLVEEKKHEISATNQMWAAIRTIIIADTMMGLDNVLAVAGAAHGNMLLVILGLAISVPIMVWGSTIILKLTERYPVVITIGAAVLAYTAAKMVVAEPLIAHWFMNGVIKYGFEVLVVVLVVAIGMRVKKIKSEKTRKQAQHA